MSFEESPQLMRGPLGGPDPYLDTSEPPPLVFCEWTPQPAQRFNARGFKPTSTLPIRTFTRWLVRSRSAPGQSRATTLAGRMASSSSTSSWVSFLSRL